MATFLPAQAAIGGVFIGAACGLYMLLQSRIAGNSGQLKALVNGSAEPAQIGFICGLLAGGHLMGKLMPHLFEAAPVPSPYLALVGLSVGLGTALANGCTSGHGLCGLSRLSLRSLAAVPTFMGAAIVTATSMTTTTFGGLAPFAATPDAVYILSLKLAAALAASLPPYFLAPASVKPAYAGLYVGSCFAFGLSIGGMVKPSVIIGALSPGKVDLTLWALFCTALAVTFALYRLAAHTFGIKQSSVYGQRQAMPDLKLIVGSALFGIGWGAGGVCPGPFVVGLGAAPLEPGSLLFAGSLALGMRVASPLWNLLVPTLPAAARRVSTAAEVSAALARPDAVVVDLRKPGVSEATGAARTFDAIIGALSAPWDAATASMPVEALPADKTAPLVLHCRSGSRAKAAAAFLAERGYTDLTNAGGPAGPAEQWAQLRSARGGHMHGLRGFMQLFDGAAPAGGGSSTWTYLLWEEATKEALLIDPVLEQAERDLAAAARLGLTLVGAVNTHCHADHVTSTGALKRRLPGFISYMSVASGAAADVRLSPGESVEWAGGSRRLEVRATPGHTNGCISLYDAKVGAVFTGDALLIGGCGRTDFQEGDAATLFDSVHARLFTLPPTTLVLPAHDYKGRCFSTVAAEKAANPRLTKTKAGFVELMANLKLAHPKKLDVAVPANLKCGGP